MKHFNPIMSLLFAMQLAATSFAAPALDPEGMAILPYSEDFSDEQSVEYLDIVDANNDGRTWYYSDIVFDIRNRARLADADAEENGAKQILQAHVQGPRRISDVHRAA